MPADEVVVLLDLRAREVLGDIDGAGVSAMRLGGSLSSSVSSPLSASDATQVQASLGFVDPAERPLIFFLRWASVARPDPPRMQPPDP